LVVRGAEVKLGNGHVSDVQGAGITGKHWNREEIDRKDTEKCTDVSYCFGHPEATTRY
jgi:hypothetical protein